MKTIDILFSGLAVAGVMLLPACGGDSSDTEIEQGQLTGFSLSPASLSLAVGQSGTVTATPIPADAKGVTYQWSAEDPTVISATGSAATNTVTAIKEGSTNVVVKSGAVTAKIPVIVTADLTLKIITVSPASIQNLATGETATLTATTIPADAEEGPETLKWTSTNEAIVTVSPAVGATTTATAISMGEAEIIASNAAGTVTARIPVSTTAKYQLVWSDEFDAASISSTDWNFTSRFQRNEELQYFQKKNASIKDGCLVLEAKKERVLNDRYEEGSTDWKKNREYAEYTSAEITTKSKHSFKYGRLEVRAKIPVCYGAWPAIWLMGQDVSGAAGGEIDVLEFIHDGGVYPTMPVSLHWEGETTTYQSHTEVWRLSHFTDKDPDWADKFHIWRMDWDEVAIRIYLDDKLLSETDLSTTINGKAKTNPFHSSQYVLLTLALDTRLSEEVYVLPMQFEIDYLRIYQR
ncbi:MAG: family 16 glycosylhydrolase [Bacteroidales bacterium]|nr:family 16 glycosylhydrolase [Bacteroidales bacterium]